LRRGGSVEITPQAGGGATAITPKNGLSGTVCPHGSFQTWRAGSRPIWIRRDSAKSSGSAPARGRVAGRPRERVDVLDLRAVGVGHHGAVLVHERGAGHAVQPVRPAHRERRQQLRHRLLTFADYDHVGTVREVLGRIVG
jgi:hypothetical protein